MNVIQGGYITEQFRVAVVAGRFNEFITNKLIGGALDALQRHGVNEETIDLIWSPGAFEIPLIAQAAAQSRRYDAIICLGAVIRGSTPHFEYVSNEVSKGIAAVALNTGIPVIFGVLTTDTIEQAIERAGTKAGNKGFDAAMAALETYNVLIQFKE
ncbi:MAG: 6,7-dimethyl-8-ribityllumazine synthase [Peptococcaceae bacterium]|jgi:6,7-dimethyl-8-ribityllumazine synthase|nr:6,7-dimethyl-8-ribityllumazine synthase [Peptococcaceae bacterium]MDR2737049.1 6,7-dimethyl-8-ribityllumazine synthase [Gracilibacteraceae bacterium]